MYAGILEFTPKMEKKDEIVKLVKHEVLPLLKKQVGFLEILPFVPENKNDKVITITLGNEKRDADRYEREVFPKVQEILKPWLLTPITVQTYTVETTLCEHFVSTMAV